MSDCIRYAAQLLGKSRMGDFLIIGVVPMIAALIVRQVLRLIGKNSARGRFAGALAFLASSMPGLVFLSMAPSVIYHLSASKGMWPCLLHCYSLTGIFAAVVFRATWKMACH